MIPCRVMKFMYEGQDIGTVSVYHKKITRDFVLTADDDNQTEFYSETLRVIQFLKCTMPRVPRSLPVLQHVPNLQILKITNTNISQIEKKDLQGYYHLTNLIIMGTKIKYLPGDLFGHTPKLEVINFCDNKIQFIEESIIWSLRSMKYINFLANENINMKYDVLNMDSMAQNDSVSFQELENEIIMNCKPPPKSLNERFNRVGNNNNGPSLFEAPRSVPPIIMSDDDDFNDLKEKINQESKLRRTQLGFIHKLEREFAELKKKVQENAQTCSGSIDQVNATIKQLNDTQKNCIGEIEKRIKEATDYVSTISNECHLFEKKTDELNQSLKACNNENKKALEKLNKEIENLTKKCEAQQNELESLKKNSESHKTYVKDVVKVLFDNNNKRLSEQETKLAEKIANNSKHCAKQKSGLEVMIKNQVAVLKADIEKKIEEIPKKRQRLDENFNVVIGNEKFTIHKSLLMANSSKIAAMVREDPQKELFEFKEEEIAIESFREILNFIHCGIAPTAESNLILLYKASCYLEINSLATIVAVMLKEKINPDNAFEILILCNAHKKDDLKRKAFEEFSKNFPNQNLNYEIASQPDVLSRLNAAKLEVDKILKGSN